MAGELGIYDFRKRIYSPELGRFLQADPVRFDAGDTNLYRYAGNNPANFFDPSGLWALPDCAGEMTSPGPYDPLDPLDPDDPTYVGREVPTSDPNGPGGGGGTGNPFKGNKGGRIPTTHDGGGTNDLNKLGGSGGEIRNLTVVTITLKLNIKELFAPKNYMTDIKVTTTFLLNKSLS